MSRPEFSPYVPRPATLVKKSRLSEMVNLYEFELEGGRPLAHKPGQFIMVSRYGVGEAPFSVSSPPDQNVRVFELAIRRIGAVTGALGNIEPGDKIGVRGPYGSSFPVQRFVGQDMLLIAGGLGFIPLRSLLYYQLKHREEFGRIILLIGTRDTRERIFVDQIEELKNRGDVEVLETVDQPDPSWTGHTGVITTLLPKVDINPAGTYVAMVGPPIMYKFVLRALREKGIDSDRIYVSLERKMKCGLGKCGHCQINDLNTCIDGPVFQYEAIRDLDHAI